MSERINFKTNYHKEANLGDMILSNKSESVHYPSISPPETLDEFKYFIYKLYDNTDNYDFKNGIRNNHNPYFP